MPPSYDCQDAGCTWPCAHHLHRWGGCDFQWYPDSEQFSHKNPQLPRALSEMKVGMKDCQFCRIFFTIGQSGDCHCGANGHGDHIPENGGCRCIEAYCRYQHAGQLRVEVVEMTWTCGNTKYELGLPTAPDARIFPWILPCMGDLHHDPGSHESLALMKGWIDNCQRSHELCGMKPRQVGGPKRLLQCLSDGSVRLVETKSCTQRCDYIALSYCWGDGKAVKKTMKKTLDRHQLGIPNEDLPPLFQEVAALAHGLDTYLWIDSLCIIQDSEEDKQEEIMQMRHIFCGALVVVVAATAESPLDSLLRVKPQSGQSNTWRTASPIRYREMDLNVQFRKRPEKAHSYTCFGDATRDTPIAKRAWCFQEKLLASRCLVFCEDEVVWECRSCCLCECGGKQEHFGDRWMDPYERKLLPLAEHEPLQLDGTLKYFADAEAAYSFWKTAVENYSRRALTLRTDRLPAISAVASIIADATGDRYLAGLWRHDLLAGLCWVTAHQGDPRPHQEYIAKETVCSPHREYIAPTWSWASLPAGIRYSRSHRTRGSRCPDLDASVDSAWADVEVFGQSGFLCGPMSEVADAAIVLSGFHCDVEMTISEGGFGAQLDFGDGDVQTVGLGRSFQALDSMLLEPGTIIDELGAKSRYLRRLPRQTGGQRQRAYSGTVHLLWLKEDVSLILTPSHRKYGAYERVGIFHKGLDEGLEAIVGTIDPPKMPKMMQRSRIKLV